jgi:hypothetical protein
MRDANVTFFNTTITLTASSNRFELNDFSPPSPTTSTSHEHVKGWNRPQIHFVLKTSTAQEHVKGWSRMLRDSLRAQRTSTSHEHVKGWSRPLRDSLRAEDIDFTRARQGVEQTAPRFPSRARDIDFIRARQGEEDKSTIIIINMLMPAYQRVIVLLI